LGPLSSSISVRQGYPWVPTDQAHSRPRQMGPAYQKTRRPGLWPTRPPEDLPEDSLDDLIQSGRVTWCARQDR
jgi:hypothetical protein